MLLALPVDGEWMPWQAWGSCSETCGNGTRTRERDCNFGLHGGSNCTGVSSETENCFEIHCPSESLDVFVTLKILIELCNNGACCPAAIATARYSNELQWLHLKVGHQNNSHSNGHQSNMRYYTHLWNYAGPEYRAYRSLTFKQRNWSLLWIVAKYKHFLHAWCRAIPTSNCLCNHVKLSMLLVQSSSDGCSAVGFVLSYM